MLCIRHLQALGSGHKMKNGFWIVVVERGISWQFWKALNMGLTSQKDLLEEQKSEIQAQR